jgi:hypothetical protein
MLQNFLRQYFTDVPNKIECSSLASFPSLVKRLWEGQVLSP